jgi:hypothetical protein
MISGFRSLFKQKTKRIKKILRQKAYDDDCKNGEYSHFE